MNKVEFTYKIGAKFKLIRHKGDHTIPIEETEYFNNIVLNSGLARMSVGEWINRLCVGSGGSTPIPTQTSLDAFIASTTDRQEWSALLDTSTSAPYYGIRMRYRFAEGAAAGNLSEIGLGWSNTDMYNRALIKDSDGVAVSITVLPDEFLDVIVDLLVYVPAIFQGTFYLRNKNGDVISTHNYTGRPVLASTSSIYPYFGRLQFNGNNSSYPTRISSTSMTAGYSDNGGTSTYHSRNSVVDTWPTTTSCRQLLILYLDTNNYSHKSFQVNVYNFITQSSYYSIGYKWELDVPIVKTNQNTITYAYEISWARYEG